MQIFPLDQDVKSFSATVHNSQLNNKIQQNLSKIPH